MAQASAHIVRNKNICSLNAHKVNQNQSAKSARASGALKALQ
jgi:hypothetical protein